MKWYLYHTPGLKPLTWSQWRLPSTLLRINEPFVDVKLLKSPRK